MTAGPHPWHLPACAILAVALVECVALLTGHNGTSLRLALIALAGLGGFFIGRQRRPQP